MLNRAEKEYIAKRPYWSLFKPLALFYRHELELALARALRRAGVELGGKRLLEDGCERGKFIRELLELGATPGRLVGLDRDAAALRDAAARTAAAVRFVQADAAALPFRDGAFDVACQSLLFSSLPPGEVRRRAAAELARVLADDGVLVWYDTVEPGAGKLRGLKLAEVRALFPGWRFAAYTFGLRFRWAFVLVNKAMWLAHALASLGVARSHALIIMTKGAAE